MSGTEDYPEAANDAAEPLPDAPRTRTINRKTRGPYRPRVAPERTAEVRDAAAAQLASSGAIGQAGPAQQARDDYGYYDNGPVHRKSGADLALNLLSVTEADKIRRNGWDVQWMPVSIYNQPVDSHQIRMAMDAGWRPAKARNFRADVTPDVPDDGLVERYGQRLFIRPLQMSLEAKAEQVRTAMEAQKAHSLASEQGRLVRDADGPGLSGMGSVVRAVPGGLSIEGETGSYAQR